VRAGHGAHLLLTNAAKGVPMRGKMLWFNETKDLGFIRTDEGERLSVVGNAFVGGQRPQGRCADVVVSFIVRESDGERQAENVVLVEEDAPRRARLRSRVIRARP
jgi:cold shock CspA family protein